MFHWKVLIRSSSTVENTIIIKNIFLVIIRCYFEYFTSLVVIITSDLKLFENRLQDKTGRRSFSSKILWKDKKIQKQYIKKANYLIENIYRKCMK